MHLLINYYIIFLLVAERLWSDRAVNDTYTAALRYIQIYLFCSIACYMKPSSVKNSLINWKSLFSDWRNIGAVLYVAVITLTRATV